MSEDRPLYRLPSPEREAQARRGLGLGAVQLLLWWSLLTQCFAARLSYAPILGKPALPPAGSLPASLSLILALGCGVLALWLGLRRLWPPAHFAVLVGVLFFALSRAGLYHPWMILAWLLRYRGSQVLAAELPRYGWLALGGAVLLAVGHFALFLYRSAGPAFPDLHGSARFAHLEDVRAAGLLEREPLPGTLVVEDAIFLATVAAGGGERPLSVTRPRHTLVLAPSRAGKGVGVVIPTLLSWRGSAVVLDVKAENVHRTAGYRREGLGQPVFLWNPTEPDTSARYNPLAEVREGRDEIRDCMIIADSVLDPRGDKKRTHWDLTAHDLITGLLLHVLYAEEKKCIATCASLLSQPGANLVQSLQAIRDTPHLGDRPHPRIAEIAQTVLNKEEEERSGVISTALACFNLYRDPLVAAVSAESDFALHDLVDGPVPVTLYIVIPPGDQERVQPLVRLMLTQMARRLVERMDFSDGAGSRRHPLLLLLDEFPTLGHLPAMERNLGYFAGYGISTLIVCQDLTQLRALYGPRESITANCDYRIVYTPNMPETAEVFSKLCGETTVHHRHVSRPVGLFGTARPTSSPAETRRPLLTVDEVLRLPQDEALVFANGCPVIRARRFRYYRDREYLRRSKIPPPAASDRLPTRNPWMEKPVPPKPPQRMTDGLPRRSARPKA